MPKLVVTDADGQQRTLEGESGYAVMEVLRDNDAGVLALCGGACSCATCHVFIDAPWQQKLPAPDGEELALLEEAEGYREGVSRLSCQIQLTDELDGMALEVAPEE